MKSMFSNCRKLDTLIGINNIITDNIINMSNMLIGWNFNDKSFPDISTENNKKLKDILKMFMGMRLGKVPNLSKWDLISMENMTALFWKQILRILLIYSMNIKH